MATFSRRRGRPPHPEILTPSEGKVLELIRQGKTNSEIALELSISVQGVKYHVTNMLGKLEVSDRVELAEWDGRRPKEATRRWGLAPLGILISKPMAAAAASLIVVASAAAVVISVRSDHREDAAKEAVDQPIPVQEFVAEVITANALITQIQLHIGLELPATADFLLTLRSTQVAIYPNGDRQRDMAGSISSAGGAADGNNLNMELSFGALPAETTYIDVVLGDYLERIPMTQAEAERQTASGTRQLRIQGGTAARADVALDPVQVDVTANAPKSLETGFGWRYVIDQVIATSTQVGITYHVEGDLSNLSPASPNRTVPFADGSARYSTTPETAIAAIPFGKPVVRMAFEAANRTHSAPTALTFARDATGWGRTTSEMNGVAVSAAINDGTPVVVWLVSDLLLLPGDVAGLLPTLVDDLGREYKIEGAGIGTNAPQLRFAGPIDPAATKLTLTLQGYSVREDGDWVLEFPVR